MKRMIAILLISINIISLTACTQKAGENEKYQVVAAEYPSMAKYPDESKYTKLNGDFDSDGFDKVYDAWWADRKKQMDQPDGYRDGLDSYLSTLVPQLLSETGGENKACSPINIYMALAMLAEVTDGNSRSQILNLLDCNDINSLHEKASAVWNANYCDDGAVTSILANSNLSRILWIRWQNIIMHPPSGEKWDLPLMIRHFRSGLINRLVDFWKNRPRNCRWIRRPSLLWFLPFISAQNGMESFLKVIQSRIHFMLTMVM